MNTKRILVGEFVHRDIFEMAAAYAFHIAGNYPFVDGNKRVALADIIVNAIEKHRSKE